MNYFYTGLIDFYEAMDYKYTCTIYKYYKLKKYTKKKYCSSCHSSL